MHFLSRLLPRRKRRVDVGKYIAPDHLTLAPVETVVEEGVLISAYSVRLAIKNRLIVAALREHDDFDIDALTQVAHEQLLMLADENAATALRIEALGEDPTPHGREGAGNDVTVTETGDIIGGSKAIRLLEHRRRPAVHRMLADALRQRALEDDFLAEQVEEARGAAWQEVSRELTRRLEPHSYTPTDAVEYSRHRDQRIREFVDDDLAELTRVANAR